MNREPIHILLVESSATHSEIIRKSIESGTEQAQLTVVQRLSEARVHLNESNPDLAIIALHLTDGKGIELLPEDKETAAYPVVIMTNRGDEQAAVEAMKAGALDYVVKSPATMADMPHLIERSLREWSHITERRRAKKELQDSEEKLRSFFESAASGMAIVSPEGKALKVNPTFCRISGYSDSEVLKKNILEVTHPDDRAQTQRLYGELRSGHRRVIDYEKRYLCKDGSVTWGHATVASVFGPDDTLKYFAANVQDITERKQAEEALRQSEQKFRTVFNNAAAGMVTLSPGGQFLGVNDAFCNFIDYSGDELSRLQVPDITHPADLERTEENYRLLGGGQSRAIDYQKRFMRKDGNIVWGQVSVASVPGDNGLPLYYVGLVQDVTKSKHDQDQIRESKQMLQLVLDYIPQHVFWKDRDSVYLGSNRNFARAAGVKDPEELIGKTDYDLPWKKEEADFYRECDRLVMEANSPELHIIEPQLQASGKQAWLDANKIPLHDGEGRVTGILGTLEDITERKRAEERLIETNLELDAFVYTVSHDLRNLLTPIIGFAAVVKETNQDLLDGQSIACLATIESLGNKMTALMEDLLVLAKVGHLPRPADPVDLNQLLEEILIGMGSLIAESGVAVERHDLPGLRMPDTLMTQIFNNLIGNAINYAGRAGSPIEIGGERIEDTVRFYVRDHGPGIPKEDQSRIFEVFYRGDAEDKPAGTGVGLATVHKISRLYGGRTWVEDTPGGGSTFWVELNDTQDSDN
jgi:PAS domain S-box-containing protein